MKSESHADTRVKGLPCSRNSKCKNPEAAACSGALNIEAVFWWAEKRLNRQWPTQGHFSPAHHCPFIQ